MTVHRSLLDPDVVRCPYPLYDEMRRERPISFQPELNGFFVSRYDLVKAILTDPRFEKGSAENDGRKFVTPSKAAQQILLQDEEIGLPVHCLSETGGEIHRAYRKIVDSYFGRQNAIALKETIEAHATALIDRIAPTGACDIVSDFSGPYALAVICGIMGFPDSLQTDVKNYADAALTYLAHVVPEEEAVAGARKMVEMHGVVRELVAERRRDPRDDVLSTLAAASIEGRPLSDREICYMVEEMVVGGNETTANAINGGLLYLAQHPEHQARLRAQPDQVTAFVEEALRLLPPILSAHRIAIEAMEIEGVAIPARAKIYLGTAAADRDPAKFACPEKFDQDRAGLNQHVVFGGGSHFCIGSGLTRMEQKVAYEQWLGRFSAIELAQPLESIRYRNTFATRSPIAIAIRFEC